MKEVNVIKKMKDWGVILVNEKMAYCGDKDKFVIFPCIEKNGFYDKEYFVKLGEWKFIEEIDNSKKVNYSDLQDDNFIEFTQDKRIFSDLMSSVSKDETRYFMNGIFIGKNDFVSTDGRTMLYTKNTQDFDDEKIVYCREFSSFYSKAEKIEIGNKSVKLTGKECTLYIKHIDGRFPIYTNVIPETKKDIIIKIPSKKDLEFHIKKCKIEQGKDSNNRIILKCEKTWTKVGFNAEYLINFLKIGVTELYGTDEMKAFTGISNNSVNAVIMPMSIK